jgi:Tol biopolymer transport system component
VPTTRLGHYEIVAPIGKGGMGEVYRALDTNLGRQVAIKILPDIFASDPERLARFEREAKTLATLNHSNIAQIYGFEKADGIRVLVMELVEGETLADRIARGPVPLNEALAFARQILDAIEAAHDQGIVHRDLKPANIKVRGDGTVKVLDFGLAATRVRTSTDVSDQPTQEMISSPGIIVGTPSYMAPEQARSGTADHPADVWAFGCVLFELLAGTPPFRGKTSTEILAEVLKADPRWDNLPADTSSAIRRVLRRCLEKDVRSRFHDVADIRIAIEDAAETPDPVRPSARSRWPHRAAWGVALLGIASAGALFVRQPLMPPETRVDIVTPPEADAGGIALSPDGTKIAYTALNNGVPYLYVRLLENGSVRAIRGTEGAALPFWSPSGQSLAFFAESRLNRVDLGTDVIQPLAAATLSPAGGSWNKDGTIVFAPNIRGRILRVQDSGGEVIVVNPEGRSPRFLADGRRFLFLGEGGAYVGSLDTPEVKLLSETWNTFARSGPPGYIMFMRPGAPGRLYIQRFDEDQLSLTGAETVLAGRVHASTDGASASVTVSENGVIAFREVSTVDAQPRRISEFDRSGTETRRIGELGGLSPTSSPKGDYVAVNRATGGGNAIWLLELARGILTPFTAGPVDQTSVWSPDGREIVFASARRGFVEMFIKSADGGEEKPLIDPPPNKNSRVPTDWAGDFLLMRENSGNFDIYALPMRGNERQPIPVLRTEYSERDAQFSPDMKWIAYESNKTGLSEIYMTRFRGTGREFPVSTNGGAQVRWNPANRNELFYVALDARLMSVTLEFGPDDTTVRGLIPVALFQTRIGTVVQGAQKQQYLVSKDGRRFLVSNVIEDALSPITLILNWKPPAN